MKKKSKQKSLVLSLIKKALKKHRAQRKEARRAARKARVRKASFKALGKVLLTLIKLIGKCALTGVIFFAVTFFIYMFNGENKLIYYVVRPFLNKHYDSQVRDRRV